MSRMLLLLLVAFSLWSADRKPAQPQDMARIVQNGPSDTEPNLMAFTLSSVEGDKLSLAALKGKALVLDFWATWCLPCREQHVLLQKVKQSFQAREDVVFLSISTDEQKQRVKPFLVREGWQDKVYFEGGLSEAYRVTSLPASIVIDRDGHVSSRMTGLVPGEFVEAISRRIRDVLEPLKTTAP